MADEGEDSGVLMGVLEVVQGPDGCPALFVVFRARTRIGRARECEVSLPGSSLARHHAVLEWYDELPLLMPVDESPILVNHQPVPRGAFLAPGDLVALGPETWLRWVPAPSALRPEPSTAQEPGGPEEPAEPEALLSDPSAPEEVARPAPGPSLAEAWGQSWRRLRSWRGVSLRARALFFSELVRRLEAHEPIHRAVEAAATTRLPQIARSLSSQILAGRGLAEALGHFSECFTPYELGMVQAGEESGRLEGQLQVLASSMRGAVELRRRLLGWLSPAILVIGLGLPMAMLHPLLQSRGRLAFLAGLVLSTLATALVVFLGALLRDVLCGFASYRIREEALLERLPVVAPVLRLRAGGRFLRSLGPLLESGIPVQRAALLAAGCTGSTRHALGLLEAARRIERGSPVLDALVPTGLLSAETLAEVGRGEEHGDLPRRLAAAEDRLHVAAGRATEAALPVVAAALSLPLAALMLAFLAVARSLLL